MIQVRDGSVTVRLDGGLERFVRDLVKAAETETVREMRRLAEEAAASARKGWYGHGGVKRQTGLSGDIRVVETVDLRRGEIRMSIGSTDKRLASGKPLPAFVHRPKATSVVLKAVTPREFFAAPRSLRGPWLPGPPRVPQLFVPNPVASDGRFLLQTLVKGPVKARMKRLGATIGAAIQARAGGGRG